jgi:hypothetical protein
MRVLSGKPLRGRPLKVKPGVQKRSGGPQPHLGLLKSTRWKARSRERWRHHQEDPIAAPVSSKSATDLLVPVQGSPRLFIGVYHDQ